MTSPHTVWQRPRRLAHALRRSPEGDPLPGVYQASIPSGKFINILRVPAQLEMRWP
ncbi:MAG TPA: hypothetical protein VFA32_24435 [Dehalococcoidia bacterium]|nr:hypothetical protein [Dehalococcoidia bacterium]